MKLNKIRDRLITKIGKKLYLFTTISMSFSFIQFLINSPSWGFTLTGNFIPSISATSDVIQTFAAQNYRLIAQGNLENTTGFLSINNTKVVAYTANQTIMVQSGDSLSDFDPINDFLPAESTVTNLTNSPLNIWIGDLDGDPISGLANTYNFVSSTGQTLLNQRFLYGITNAAIEVTLLANESLTITTVGSDVNPQLGDDGRFITIAESQTESIPEGDHLVGLFLFVTMCIILRLKK